MSAKEASGSGTGAKSKAKAVIDAAAFPRAAVEEHWRALRPYLERWAGSGTPPPVLLLKGLPGIGKRAVATKLAQWVLCERGPVRSARAIDDAAESRADSSHEDDGPSLFGDAMAAPTPPSVPVDAHDRLEPCGVCSSCVPFRSGRNVNFVSIEREEDSRALKIEHFRELKEKLGYGGFDSPFRVHLIPDAEDFTIAAANSVLKLFEEPPTGWFFFLTSSDPARIPITILSRSQAIGLVPLADSIIREALANGTDRREGGGEDGDGDTVASGEAPSAATIETLTRLSQGSLTRAAEFRRIDFAEKTRHLAAIFRGDGDAPGHLYDWLVNQPDAVTLVIDLIETFLMDLITLATNAGANARPLFHEEFRADFLKFITTPGAPAIAIERLDRLQDLRRLLLTNVNQKLVFAELGWILRFI